MLRLVQVGDHRQHGDIGIALQQVVLVLHAVVKQLAHRDEAAAEHQTQQHAQRRIAGIAGRRLAGGRHGGVHHPGGGAVDDVGDAAGQHLGDGVGHPLRLLRVGHGHIDLHHLRGVDGAGADHVLHILIGIIHTGGADHLVQRCAGVEDDNVGVHQALGRRQVRVAQAHLRAAHGQRVVVHIHQRAGRVHGRDYESRIGKGKASHHRNGHQNQPGMPPERLQQRDQIDLRVSFVLIHDLNNCPPDVPSDHAQGCGSVRMETHTQRHHSTPFPFLQRNNLLFFR